MKSLLKSILLSAGLFCSVISYSQARLEVNISNIRSSNGQIIISLYDSQEQFPRYPKKTLGGIVVQKKELKNQKLSYTIEGIPPGKYALSLLDDENNSGDMDYSKIGIPKEGFGFSNVGKTLLTPPAFNKCLFELKDGDNIITIKVQYIS